MDKQAIKIALLLAAAVCSYLAAGVNYAVIFSKVFYHQDIRTLGSGNPGFTNFKRVFGGKLAWVVLLLDLLKTAIPVIIFSMLFEHFMLLRQFGAVYSGFFAMLGHAYPIWYDFKGGKSFIAGVSTVWVVDWRIGLISLIVFLTILFVTHYMSLASVASTLLYPIMLPFFGCGIITAAIAALSALLVAWRHKDNIKRLINGTEKKFYLKSKPQS